MAAAASDAPEGAGQARQHSAPIRLDLNNPRDVETLRQKQYGMGVAALTEGDVTKAATHLAVFYHLLPDPQERAAIVNGWQKNLSPEVFHAVVDQIHRLEASAMVELNVAEDIAIALATFALSYTASVPFEVVKLTLQTQPELIRRGAIAPWEPLAGPLDCARRRLLTSEGLSAMFAANFFGVAMVVPRLVVSKSFDALAALPLVQSLAPSALQPSGSLGTVGVFARYMLPGLASQAAVHAMQVARTRVAAGQKGALGGFYNSFSPGFALLNSAVHVQTALLWHGQMERRKESGGGSAFERSHPWATEVVLTVAKDVAAALALYPLDVARRRMMLAPPELPYASLADCVRTVWQEEGPSALFSGWGACVLQTAVSSVVMAAVAGPIRKAYVGFKTRQKQAELAKARARVRQGQAQAGRLQ